MSLVSPAPWLGAPFPCLKGHPNVLRSPCAAGGHPELGVHNTSVPKARSRSLHRERAEPVAAGGEVEPASRRRPTFGHTKHGGCGSKRRRAPLTAFGLTTAMLVRARAAAVVTTTLPGMRCLWRGGGSGAAAACFPLGRALLDVRGAETAVFLQGLLTNDVTQLVAGDGPPAAPALPRALYAHALNVQGRCLYDLILYRLHESPEEEPHILLECDGGVLDAIQKHLKLYKIRRKVNIAPCLDLSLWAVIPGEQAGDIASSLAKCADQAPILSPDPRTEVMGWRVITKKGVNLSEIIPGSHVGNIQDYHRHRYKQGIPEGVKDLPPGIALPLESNLAYMNGISFTKGCYVGQELTARTHHVGVIRKRLLPVQFPAPLPTDSIPEGADIVTESGKSAGKFRFGGGELGIALLRLANVNEALYLNRGGDKVKLTASIPEWWPKTASK